MISQPWLACLGPLRIPTKIHFRAPEAPPNPIFGASLRSAAGELDPRAYLSLALFFWEASLVDLLRALLDQLRAKSLLDAAIFVAALLEDGEELRTSLVACDRLGEALAVTDGWRLGQRHVLAQVWERRRQSPAGPSINMSAGVADRVSRQ